MNIERITGEYIVLSSEDEFKAFQEEFNKLEEYSEKLNFWQDLPYFKERSVKGSFQPFSITHNNIFVQSHDVQEKDRISIIPDMKEESLFLNWLIDLPDCTSIQWKTDYDAFDNKDVFLETMLERFYREYNEDGYFQKAYKAWNKKNIKSLIDKYRSIAKTERPEPGSFVTTIRKAKQWYLFLSYVGKNKLVIDKQTPEEVQYAGILEWTIDESSLILLISLLYDCKMIKAPNKTAAFREFGKLFNRNFRNPYDNLDKIFDRNGENYEPRMLNAIMKHFEDLRNIKGHRKNKADK